MTLYREPDGMKSERSQRLIKRAKATPILHSYRNTVTPSPVFRIQRERELTSFVHKGLRVECEFFIPLSSCGCRNESYTLLDESGDSFIPVSISKVKPSMVQRRARCQIVAFLIDSSAAP